MYIYLQLNLLGFNIILVHPLKLHQIFGNEQLLFLLET